MRVPAKFVLAIGFVIALTVQAQAGPLLNAQINPTPGQETDLNDASVSNVFHADGTPIGPNEAITTGDIVIGMLRIGNGISPPANTLNANQQLVAVFSFQIGSTSSSSTAALDTLNTTFQATPTSSGKSLAQLLPGLGIQPTDSVAIVENSNGPNLTNTASLTTALATINTTYTLDQTMGLTGPNDFFSGYLQLPHGTAFTPTNLANQGSSSPLGQDSGVLTHDLNPTGLANYTPVKELNLVTGTTASSDWGFSAQLVVPTNLQLGLGYEVGDHSIIKVNASVAPEPTSLTLFVLGSLGLGIAARRRRKQGLVA